MKNKYLKIIDLFAEMQDVENVYDRKSRSYGDVEGTYTPAEAFLLKYLFEHESVSMSEVAKKMYKSKSAVSQMVKKIEAKDLIKINKNNVDQRNTDIQVTNKGEQLYEAHKQVNIEYAEKLENYLSVFTEEEMKTIMKFLSVYSNYRKDTSL